MREIQNRYQWSSFTGKGPSLQHAWYKKWDPFQKAFEKCPELQDLLGLLLWLFTLRMDWTKLCRETLKWYKERMKMAEIWQAKSSITQIALGRSKSTVSWERMCRLDQEASLQRFVLDGLCSFGGTPSRGIWSIVRLGFWRGCMDLQMPWITLPLY